VGDGPDYRILLANFEKVNIVFAGLKKKYQEVITDICHRMGDGMAEFAAMKNVRTVKHYNLYCHYVAGLVGHGLTNLFAISGLEDSNLNSSEGLRVSNSMGLFLQKTNIIRDYLEDLDQGRTWWPDEIWKNYGETLETFKNKPNAAESVSCLNHMVCDALEHVPDCLAYLSRLSDPQIFRFCAIPQVMAIATLAGVYNNKKVFRQVIKIRKGLSCKLMLETNDVGEVNKWFYQFATQIRNQIPNKDPNAKRTAELVDGIQKATKSPIPRGVLQVTSILAWIILVVGVVYMMSRYKQRSLDAAILGSQPARPSADYIVVLAIFGSLSYIFGFFGVANI